MIKLNIMNMNEFLKTVNECIGEVKMIDSDGNKQNVNGQDEIQFDLRRRHRENRNYLQVNLDIPDPKDYLKIVFFTIGDC